MHQSHALRAGHRRSFPHPMAPYRGELDRRWRRRRRKRVAKAGWKTKATVLVKEWVGRRVDECGRDRGERRGRGERA